MFLSARNISPIKVSILLTFIGHLYVPGPVLGLWIRLTREESLPSGNFLSIEQGESAGSPLHNELEFTETKQEGTNNLQEK